MRAGPQFTPVPLPARLRWVNPIWTIDGRPSRSTSEETRAIARRQQVPNQDGNPFSLPTGPTDSRDLGRPASWRRPEGDAQPAGADARPPSCSRGSLASPRHLAVRGRAPIAPVVDDLPAAAAGDRCGEPGRLSRRPFLSAGGSRPFATRGRRAAGAHSRRPRARDPLRPRHQPGRTSAWEGLVRALSRPPLTQPERSAAGPCLRAAQFSKAPPRRTRDRPLYLWDLVRRMGACGVYPGLDDAPRRLLATELAAGDGLATRRRPHRLARSARRSCPWSPQQLD